MMNALSTTVFAGVLALSLAACADMDWTRPGADKAAVSRDLDECRGATLGRSQPAGVTATQETSIVGAAAPTRPTTSSNERFVAEHEDVSRCMVRRGYQLTPAK